LVSIFRSYHPAVIFMLLVYVMIFRLVLFLEPVVFQPPANTNLLSQITYHVLETFAGNRNWLYDLISVLLVFFQALYFNYLINYYRVLSRSSYLPAVSYILISSLFIEFLSLTPALMANTFLLFALAKIFSLYKKEQVTGIMFDAAFLVSIASLFFFPYVAFYIFILASISLLRPFSLREYLISIIGLILPYYFAGVYFFWIGRLPEFFQMVAISDIRFNTEVLERSLRILIIGIPVIIVMGWTALYIQANLFRMVVQVRNYLIVFVWFFVSGILSLLIQFQGDIFHFIWLVVPGGISFAFFFTEFRRKFVSEIVHLFLILAILFFEYIYLFNSPQ